MPTYFKALATITVWVLFVLGCIAILIPIVEGSRTGVLFADTPPPLQIYIAMGLGIIGLALSVVCMKLRQMLE